MTELRFHLSYAGGISDSKDAAIAAFGSQVAVSQNAPEVGLCAFRQSFLQPSV